MPTRPPVVNIFASFACEADATLARALKRHLEAVAPVVNVEEVDALAVAASDGSLAHLSALKIPVFILSRDCLTDPHRRAFIARGDPLLGRPSAARRYYLCRECRPAQLLDMYPELHSIANETMLVSSDAIGQVVADLSAYLRSDYVTHPHKGRRLALFVLTLPFRALLALAYMWALTLLDVLGRLLFFIGFVAGPVLTVLLLLDAPDIWLGACAGVCLFTAGMALHNVDTLDHWPLLGPRWRASPAASDEGHSARDAVTDTSVCDKSHLDETIVEWRSHHGWLLILRSLALGTTLVPGLVAQLITNGGFAAADLSAFVAGLSLPLLLTRYRHSSTQTAAAHRGLTEPYLLKTEARLKRFTVEPMPVLPGVKEDALKCFSAEELTTMRRWASLVAFSGACAVDRPWYTRPDHVFVSYVWADDPHLGIAREVSRGLDSCGVAHYIDQRPIDSGFVGWRTNVAVELVKATHILLVVSPSIAKGTVVGREMRAILCRWFTDALPSVVCIAEHNVAETLKHDPCVPLHLRFFLTWCPRLTPREASDPAVLAAIIAQRRRQGRFRDWASLLFPERASQRSLASLVPPCQIKSSHDEL